MQQCMEQPLHCKAILTPKAIVTCDFLNTLSPCPAQRFDMPLQISNFKGTTGAIIVVFRIKGEQSQLIDIALSRIKDSRKKTDHRPKKTAISCLESCGIACKKWSTSALLNLSANVTTSVGYFFIRLRISHTSPSGERLERSASMVHIK